MASVFPIGGGPCNRMAPAVALSLGGVSCHVGSGHPSGDWASVWHGKAQAHPLRRLIPAEWLFYWQVGRAVRQRLYNPRSEAPYQSVAPAWVRSPYLPIGRGL